MINIFSSSTIDQSEGREGVRRKREKGTLRFPAKFLFEDAFCWWENPPFLKVLKDTEKMAFKALLFSSYVLPRGK